MYRQTVAAVSPRQRSDLQRCVRYFALMSQDELTGGTGRLAGAFGLVMADVTFDPTTAPISAQFTRSGTATLPKKRLRLREGTRPITMGEVTAMHCLRVQG